VSFDQTKGRIIQTSIKMTCHSQMIFHKMLTDGWQNLAAETYICQHTYRLNFLCWRWFVPKCSCESKATSNIISRLLHV